MKISLVITALNEQHSVGSFIESVFCQTKKPDEVIIVDGGSSDRTVDKIKDAINRFRDKGYNLKFKILTKKGNRSIGRNEGIKNSVSNIILSSDFGCILDKNWIKNISEPFKDQRIDVVSGYYRGIVKNIFQKCLVPYVLVMNDKINPSSFLPSARSMAFRKSIWQKIGGFPEKYSHNEDYVFANRLKKVGANMLFKKDAFVLWVPRKNFRDAFKMFFRFALGDVSAGILRKKVFLLFGRYSLGLYLIIYAFRAKSFFVLSLVFFIILSYFAWSIAKNYKYVRNTKAIFILPLIQLLSDAAVILGSSLGLIARLRF